MFCPLSYLNFLRTQDVPPDSPPELKFLSRNDRTHWQSSSGSLSHSSLQWFYSRHDNHNCVSVNIMRSCCCNVQVAITFGQLILFSKWNVIDVSALNSEESYHAWNLLKDDPQWLILKAQLDQWIVAATFEAKNDLCNFLEQEETKPRFLQNLTHTVNFILIECCLNSSTRSLGWKPIKTLSNGIFTGCIFE